MPLCTIFVKWPVPTGPAWTNPPSAGASAPKIGYRGHVLGRAADHQAVTLCAAPHPPLVPASMKPIAAASSPGAAPSRASWSCRRRSRRPLGTEAELGDHLLGRVAGGDHCPHHLRRPSRDTSSPSDPTCEASLVGRSRRPRARRPMRVAMFPPILPSPTMPIFTRTPPPGRPGAAAGPSVAVVEREQVAVGLCPL